MFSQSIEAVSISPVYLEQPRTKKTTDTLSRNAQQALAKKVHSIDLSHRNLGYLPEKGNGQVHGGADRSKVVEGNEGIHLEFGAIEESLNHADSDCLERNSSNLVEETSQDEIDFTKRGQGNTNHNQGNISELL